MSLVLNINGQEYIPATTAGKQFGYTKEYLLLLAKEQKIGGQKIGNKWYINLASAEAFFRDFRDQKKSRLDLVREERKRELKEHTKARDKNHARIALVETLVIVVIGLSFGVTGYLGTTTTVASVQNSEYGFFENLAIALYEFISPQTIVVSTYPENKILVSHETEIDESAISAHIGTTTNTSLVIASDEIFTETALESVRNAFSDEVEVSIDPENADTGLIVPVFKNSESEAYRFLMVPVNEETP